jgi:hypothetical protein
MPAFLERKLRANVPRGVDPDRYVYGAMNNMGAMRGSKITAKGRKMEAKHKKKLRAHRGVTDLL